MILFGGPILMVLFNLFRIPVDRNSLGCGMVGFCGAGPADPNIIRMLLMYNNTRGGDSTGWVVNDVITKETITVDKFLEKHPLIINAQDANRTIIAHARRASYAFTRGDKNLAHPFGTFIDGVESDKYALVLAMNGSFNNEEEFAEHFKFKFFKNKNSDTEMLAHVMCQLGPKKYKEALELYDGSATILFYSPAKRNTLNVYQDPQRKIYGWRINETTLYISSMKESFKAVGAPDDQIVGFDDYCVYSYKDGKLLSQTKIERNPLKKVVPIKHAGWGSTYDGYDSYEDYHTPAKNTSSSADYYKLDVDAMDKGGDSLYFAFDKYFRNHHPITGEFFVGPTGELTTMISDPRYKPEMEKMYFVVGYRMKNKEAYEKFHNKVIKKNTVDFIELGKIHSSEILEYVDYPIMMIGNKEQRWICPKEMQDKYYKKEGDKLEFTHFLSAWALELKFTKDWVRGRKDVQTCKLEGFKSTKKEEPKKLPVSPSFDEIVKGFDEFHVKNFIKSTITANPAISAESLFNRTRLTILKMNGKEPLKKYFYELLLQYAYQQMISGFSSHRLEEIKKEGNKKCWDNVQVQNDLDTVIKSIANKLKDVSNHTTTPVSEAPVKPFSQLTPKDKLRTVKMNYSGVSAKEVFDSLKKSNRFFINDAFCKDMLNVKFTKFASFAAEYLANPENVSDLVAEFAQAICFCLLDYGHITEKALVDLMIKDNQDFVYDVAIRYENYALDNPFEGDDQSKFYVDKTGEINNESGEITDKEPEDEVETYDPEAIEDETEAMLVETLKGIKHLQDHLFMISESQRTVRIKLIEEKVRAMYEKLRKELYDASTIPQEL